MSSEQKLSGRTAVAAIFTGILASACCIGPLLLAVLGIGGAGLLVKFEPYRPYFMGFTVLLLGAGFYFAYFRKPAVVEGIDACGCEQPKKKQWGKVMLWVATVIAVVAMASPYLLATFSDGSFSKANAGKQAAKQTATRQVTLKIKGMTCGGCIGNVTRALKGVPGIYAAKVTFKPQQAVVRFNPQKTNPTQMIAAIKKAGYQAKLAPQKTVASIKTTTLNITGMTCGGCVFNLTRALKRVKGVVSAKVTLQPQRAIVRYEAKKVNVRLLVRTVKRAGYNVVGSKKKRVKKASKLIKKGRTRLAELPKALPLLKQIFNRDKKYVRLLFLFSPV